VAEPNSGQVEQGRPETEADRLFHEMSEFNPPRKVDVSGGELGGNGAGDGFGEGGERIKKTDLQVADDRLNPDLSDKGRMPFLNFLQMGRTFPDVYNPLFRILVKYVVKTFHFPVAEAMARVNTALSISIDGEGRIDEIALAKGLGEIKAEAEKRGLLP
jgi:hypothetical protein